MRPLAALLADVHDHGARVWRHGDRLRIVPAGKLPPALKAELVRHRSELLEVLPLAPPEVAALVAAPAEPDPWIVSSGGDGDMRLVVASHPSDWPPTVYRAAALVELLDARTRADRADAREVAVELEAVLDALRREGVRAWLTS